MSTQPSERPSENSTRWIRTVFWTAALYDGLLGLAFLFAHAPLYDAFGVQPPNHAAYVQFPALLLVIFSIMFVRIALDPVPRRELMIYGVLLKLCYTGLVAVYWMTSAIPDMWKPMAGLDLIWAVLFVIAFCQCKKKAGLLSQPG